MSNNDWLNRIFEENFEDEESLPKKDEVDEEFNRILAKFNNDSKEVLKKPHVIEEKKEIKKKKEVLIPSISFEASEPSLEYLLASKIENSMKKMTILFSMNDMNYQNILDELILYFFRLDKNITNLYNMSKDTMDKTVFTYLAEIQNSYTDQYCEVYKMMKKQVLNCLDNSIFYNNECICNSAYINALTVECVYEYCFNNKVFSDKETIKRIEKDGKTLNEKFLKIFRRQENKENIKVVIVAILGFLGITAISLPLIATSGFLGYLLGKNYLERKKIIELDREKMRELYPEINNNSKNQGYSR